jgi:hypothetical protein
MELFAGAIGLFKNPSSHREVDYADPVIATDIILFGRPAAPVWSELAFPARSDQKLICIRTRGGRRPGRSRGD